MHEQQGKGWWWMMEQHITQFLVPTGQHEERHRRCTQPVSWLAARIDAGHLGERRGMLLGGRGNAPGRQAAGLRGGRVYAAGAVRCRRVHPCG